MRPVHAIRNFAALTTLAVACLASGAAVAIGPSAAMEGVPAEPDSRQSAPSARSPERPRADGMRGNGNLTTYQPLQRAREHAEQGMNAPHGRVPTHWFR